jgi:hypothetical protein
MQPISLRRLILFTAVVLLLPSCSDTADDSADTTLAPTTTTTTAVPTTTTAPSLADAAAGLAEAKGKASTTTTEGRPVVPMSLGFDGDSCTYEGPTELTPGPVELVFLNQSEEAAAVNLVSISGGHTIQDVIDDIGPEPSTGHHPYWTRELGTWQSTAPGESHRWEGDLSAGLYAMVCNGMSTLGVWGVWIGTGLTVEQ